MVQLMTWKQMHVVWRWVSNLDRPDLDSFPIKYEKSLKMRKKIVPGGIDLEGFCQTLGHQTNWP